MPRLKPVHLLLALLLVPAHLFVWKPVRTVVTQRIVLPTLQAVQPEGSPISYYNEGRNAFYVIRTDVEGTWQRNAEDRSQRKPVGLGAGTAKNVFGWSGFGGLYFLLGGMILLGIGAGWRRLLELFLLHQLLTLLSIGFLLAAVLAHPAFLYGMNLVVAYLTPAATMAFVLVRKG